MPETGIEPLVRTTLTALRHYVTEGEWEDIKASFPKDVAAVLV